MEHLPASLLNNVLYQMQTESGGNPNAINLTDINAQRGDPSKGLMQVISETFAAYRNPSLSSNIYDPLANIFAGVNYAVHRYGNPGWLSVLGHGHGYANGTSSAQPGLAVVGEHGPELVNFRGGEQVIPHQFIPRGGSGGQVHVHLHNEGVIGSQPELMRWLNNGIDELARSSRLTYALQRSPSAPR
jgi:SLT domain-containing protein